MPCRSLKMLTLPSIIRQVLVLKEANSKFHHTAKTSIPIRATISLKDNCLIVRVTTFNNVAYI